tara:strand:- start:3291 stop:3797 length:507 start_codon:yes stop_codon:yes gene_type:complete
MKVANYAKTGATYYGYYQSISSLFIGTILLFIGIYISFVYKAKRTHFTQAKIINDVSCDKETGKKKTMYNCNLVIEYKHNDKVYENNHLVKSNRKFTKDDTIKIRYNPNDPDSFDSFPTNPKYVGYVTLSFGMFSMIMALLCMNYPMICGGMAIARNVSSALNPKRSN